VSTSQADTPQPARNQIRLRNVYYSTRPTRQTTACLGPARNGEEIEMLQAIAWIIGIIVLIGLLVVFGVLDLIF
jgi:hypothetical protein